MASKPRLPRGRQFFANPGPTNIPDSVLLAVAHVTVDFNDPAFMPVYEECIAGLKRILKTEQEVFMYTGSGHAAWEASLVNLFSPGDTVAIIETGHFSQSWAQMAEDLSLKAEVISADWHRGVDFAALRATLAADKDHRIKAICAVHNETATGMELPLKEVRAALDATKHPALLLSDTISSLGSLDFRMDAKEAHKTSRLPKSYLSWTNMLTRKHKSFVGTVPTSFFYGLQESLRLLEEEGLDQVFARHSRLAEAVRRCVRHWSGNAGPQLFCMNPDRYSDSVTAILMPEGHDAEAVRRTALQSFNVSLGGGLGPLGGKVFRIGHLGDLNEPMILGTLSVVEMALKLNGVPHAPGGVAAAMEYLAEAAR
jgi:alanine-glyoxylate transaminase/serine-glyoxylate transaminase/serine-pyruvate transaminase